ncbi:MAG: exosortase O [Methylococcales bacterium]|nr:exosortase O [Methylococcales bacterium]
MNNDRFINKNKQYKSPYLLAFYIGLIILTSGILFLPVFIWFVDKLFLINGYLHGLVLLVFLVLAVHRLLKLKISVIHPPVLIHPALLIWLPAIFLYLANEVNIGFHTLSAVLFIVYAYGLSGHFLSKNHWYAILLPVLLLILVLPFEQYLDLYVGFPLRLLSSKWAASILQVFQSQTISVESILVVDNKAAIVDLDCSGIKSLWVGLIFYLLLTWVEKYRLGLRWFLLSGLFIGLLIAANTARIVLLVILDLVLNQAELARLLHQSLGLLGFIVSSLIIWFLLHYFVPKNTPTSDAPRKKVTFLQGFMSTLVILSVIGLAIYNYKPFQKPNKPLIKPQFKLSEKYHLSAIKLNPQEITFFKNNASVAQKYIFEIPHKQQTIKASMVLVWSQQWRSQHVPENCYLSQGYTIINKGVWTLEPQFNVRYLNLRKIREHQSPIPFSGVYWFQSKNRTTPDYSSRVFDSFFKPKQSWVMVSILWQTPINPTLITPFLKHLQMELSHENK